MFAALRNLNTAGIPQSVISDAIVGRRFPMSDPTPEPQLTSSTYKEGAPAMAKQKKRVFVIQLLVEGEDVLDAISHMDDGKVEAIVPFEKTQEDEDSPTTDAVGFRFTPKGGESEDEEEERRR